MSLMKRMRLTEGPAEIATLTRKVWGTLFETYGWEWFDAIEARGVIIHAHSVSTAEARSIRDNLVNRGFAEYTEKYVSRIEELTES